VRADGLNLEAVGIKTERGRISVDSHFRTNVSNIYAIGDVIPGPMLAHKAEEDGVAAAEIMAGRAGHVNYNTVPGIIYTHPEVANVGLTEQEAVDAGYEVACGKFSFMANSRARCTPCPLSHTSEDVHTDNVSTWPICLVGRRALHTEYMSLSASGYAIRDDASCVRLAGLWRTRRVW
jgi:hypothetical protein